MRNNEYIFKFLKQALLGQSVKSKENVLRQCIKLADKDMLSGGRFIVDKFETQKQEDRINIINNLLKVDGTYCFKREIIKDVATECFWKWDEEREGTINGIKRVYTSVGLAQKLYNMTFKYLYIYYDRLPEEIGQICFGDCDCPLDSVILNNLGEKEKKWTRLNYCEYKDIQEKIDNEIENNKWKKHMGRLIYDEKWDN